MLSSLLLGASSDHLYCLRRLDLVYPIWHSAEMILQPPDDLPDEHLDVWHQAAEYFYQGLRHQRSGDLASAIQSFKLSHRLYPLAEVLTTLGSVFAMLNLFAEAIAVCQEAIALDSKYGTPYNDVGAYLMELERYHEAIPWLQQAIDAPRCPNRNQAYHNIGRLYERIGEWNRALEAYEAAVNASPKDRTSHGALLELRARIN
jgi:tetratricopeptide (TPR) repeat protein